MLSTLASIGSFASGLGSFASGLGLGSKQKRGPSLADMRAENNRALRDSWDVTMESAKKHGIHPLAALGFNPSAGQSFSLSGGGSSGSSFDLGLAGQGLERAASAFKPKSQRLMEEKSAQLSLENQQLENDYIRAKIQHMNAPGTGPGLPSPSGSIPGQGAIVNLPSEIIGKKGPLQVGRPADYQYFDTDVGPVRMPGEQMKNAMEDNLMLELEWLSRNRLMPVADWVLYDSPPARAGQWLRSKFSR